MSYWKKTLMYNTPQWIVRYMRKILCENAESDLMVTQNGRIPNIE